MKSFFSQTTDGVNLCGLRFTTAEFRMLEPTLKNLPVGIKIKHYEQGECHYESGDQLVLCEKKWEDADRYIDRYPEFLRLHERLHADDAKVEQTVENERRKRLPYAQRRALEYPSINELVIAIWELLVEYRPELAAALQEKRLEIKKKHPPEGS